MACVFIVVGHLAQGLLRSDIVHPNYGLSFTLWMLYMFHVELFFICSGYLYQRSGRVTTWKAWARNVFHKAVALGVPYFVFSVLIWLLKSKFLEFVNVKSGSLSHFLFAEPATAPYWYLYTLFFLFVFIPNIRSSKVLGVLMVLFVILYMFSSYLSFNFILYSCAQYGYWFVLGMLIRNVTRGNVPDEVGAVVLGTLMIGTFMVGGYLFYSSGYRLTFNVNTIFLGTLACIGILMVIWYFTADGVTVPFLDVLAGYTFPVYLLHTVYAGAVRNLLRLMGIRLLAVHVVCGLLAGIGGSILTAWICHKLIYPEFVFYPWKVIRRVVGRRHE